MSPTVRRPSMAASLLLIVLPLAVVAVSPSSANAQIRPKIAVRKGSQASKAFLPNALKGKRIMKRGSLSAMGRKSVRLSNGRSMTLSTVAARAFKEQDSFATRASASNIGLLGRKRSSAEVIELSDSFLLVKRTAVMVVDPDQFARKSPLYRRFRSSQTGSLTTTDLDAEAKAALARFKRSELTTLAADNPLKVAAAKGDNALLRALAAGYGDFEVVDTVEMPKVAPRRVNGKLLMPKVVGGVVDYSQQQRFSSVAPVRASVRKPVRAVPRELPVLPGSSRSGGASSKRKEFLAGFTVSDSWVFTKQYNYTSGFARFTVGAHYAFGLRIPIVATARMWPIRFCESSASTAEHTKKTLHLGIQVETKDANERYYKKAGLSESDISSGKEVALEAGFGYGFKIRAGWMTIASRRYSEKAFDEGVDFTPPLGRRETVGELFVPPEFTNSKFGVRHAHGSVELGFKVEVDGDVKFQLEPTTQSSSTEGRWKPSPVRALSTPGRAPSYLTKVGSGPRNRGPFEMTFSDGAEKIFDLDLGKVVGFDHRETRFKVRLTKPRYKSKWSITPGFRLNITARYKGYGFSRSRTFWINAARIPIGELTLDRHKGTPNELVLDGGVKVFHRNTSNSDYCSTH